MPELIAAYPDAKVILTIRDLDDWHSSCENTMVGVGNPPLINLLGLLDAFSLKRWLRMHHLSLHGQFQSDEVFRKRGKEIDAARHD